MNQPAATPNPVDLSAESVAGEEDPGATLDLSAAEVRAGAGGDSAPSRTQPPMNPGDEAPEGTPGTGEDLCPRCGGSGRIDAGPCPDCGGTGKVNVGIGGA
jgi:hypothetical protein